MYWKMQQRLQENPFLDDLSSGVETLCMRRYYGLLAQRYCGHNQTWQALFEDCFRKQYMFVHRLETNKLRNVGRFFAHLLATDSVSWGVLDCIRITEEDTTSSSRIFIKILFQVGFHSPAALYHIAQNLYPPCCNIAALHDCGEQQSAHSVMQIVLPSRFRAM